MSIGNVGKSNFTKAVKALLNRIYDDTVVADSLFEQAALWFSHCAEREQQRAEKEQQVFLFKHRQAQAGKGDQALIERNLQQAQSEQDTFNQQQQQEQSSRYEAMRQLCADILALSESNTFEETNLQTAKVLGTIQLMSPTAGKNVAPANQKNKHLYKALLSLRLLDRLLLDGNISHPYILDRYQANADTALEDPYQPFRDDV
jgi:ATPase subunit of ABC transporter with duplicated ATPase domains